ncbi:zinc-binding dehydrogenase [Lentzea sp. BCCO 10_0856]|uniref:Zinc-binding dehydrogenase n=1 Tax=Lentzea miocenica TaxID=3095431 RepID=A0ABU4T6L7_9PSEU|nr:zinc-binding dehydrogenase [Lentzea sp. BCCO 10_0856]MDX8033791.1 zinc-binding dehydrogenase [Lentzea sp. BCCO 10_0856]
MDTADAEGLAVRSTVPAIWTGSPIHGIEIRTGGREALALQGTTAFESIGGAVGKRAFELLKDGVGRMVVFGFASGEPLDVSASDVFRKGVAVMGLPRDVTPEEVFSHHLKPVLGEVYQLEEIAEAHRALEARTTQGKLIARP